MNFKETLRKLIISGNRAELLKYEVFDHQTGQKPPDFKEDKKDASLLVSTNRTRKELTRLVYSNFNQWGERTKILTLTKQANLDLTQAAGYFKKFTRDISNLLHYRLQYVSVPEFQERGAVHYHMLMFNFPFMDKVYTKLRGYWNNERLQLNTIPNQGNLNSNVKYITKYITKQATDPRFFNRRRYYPSKGLRRPIEITNDQMIEMIGWSLQNFQTKKQIFQTQFCGKMEYTEYDFSKVGNVLNLPVLVSEARDYLTPLLANVII
jgi:hypothetical protein